MKRLMFAMALVWALGRHLMGATWSLPPGENCSLVVPHAPAYAFPDGFKATVRFACDFGKITERAQGANLFCKGNNFQDAYCVMVRRDGKLFVDLKGVEPSYHIVPMSLVSGREYLLEIYVTPDVVRIFVDGVETGGYPIVGRLDFGNTHPLRIGTMGCYRFAGHLSSVRLEPLSAVVLPPGGPAPALREAPRTQARAEILWTRTICREEGRYIGWPTAIKLANGDLIAVFSGDREAHIDPFGKVQLVRSTDGGETWRAPMTIVNGPIDDRDAGIVQMPDGTLVLTYFTSTAYRDQLRPKQYKPTDSRYWWQRHDDKISDEVRKTALGYYRVLSTDNGHTWSKPEKMKDVSHAPHGPALMNDGSLLQLGRTAENERSVISAWRSTDKGATWTCLCPRIADTNGENDAPMMFHEPNCIQLPSGKLVGLVRYHGADNCLRQTVSEDGGKTWTPMTKTGMLGLPPHIVRLADGKLVCVFGRRCPEPTAFGEYAVISDDDGATWDVANEIILSPSHNDDLGYPTSCVLDDGTILTVYYQQPKVGEKPQLMATKWRVTR